MKVESLNIDINWEGNYQGHLIISDGSGARATVVVPDTLCRELINQNKFTFESLFSAKKFDYINPCKDPIPAGGVPFLPADTATVMKPQADDDIPF